MKLTWKPATSMFYVEATDRRYTVARYVGDGVSYVAWFQESIHIVTRLGPYRTEVGQAKADAQAHADGQGVTA